MPIVYRLVCVKVRPIYTRIFFFNTGSDLMGPSGGSSVMDVGGTDNTVTMLYTINNPG